MINITALFGVVMSIENWWLTLKMIMMIMMMIITWSAPWAWARLCTDSVSGRDLSPRDTGPGLASAPPGDWNGHHDDSDNDDKSSLQDFYFSFALHVLFMSQAS